MAKGDRANSQGRRCGNCRRPAAPTGIAHMRPLPAPAATASSVKGSRLERTGVGCIFAAHSQQRQKPQSFITLWRDARAKAGGSALSLNRFSSLPNR